MEGFRQGRNEKKPADSVPEIASTLEELEARKAKLESEVPVVEAEMPIEPNLNEQQEKALKDTINSVLEK